VSQPGLVLHIGSGKTGTSSIQQFLRINRPRLARRGILYPHAPGRARHTQLGFFVKTEAELARTVEWTRAGHGDVAAFQEDFERRLTDEIRTAAPKRVVMSDEALYNLSDDSVRRLRALADRIADRVRVVVYLRRQDDQLISRYQQEVKVGEVRTLADFATADLTTAYDYRAKLALWERYVEPERVVVRRFEHTAMLEGSLYADVLAAAGIPGPVDDMKPINLRNKSLDAEAVEVLRLLNICHSEAGTDRVHVDNRDFLRPLADASTGPVLTLPDRTLDVFMDRWSESNRAVAGDFLGRTGDLFELPRKSGNTTTEQRLDPARVDHFIDLLELPEDLQERLRRVAEREARG
jgi:hypothetical protein